MQNESIEVLLSGVTGASSDINLVQPAKDLCEKFRKAFRLYAKCHNVFNGNITNDTIINQFGMTNYYQLLLHTQCLLVCCRS